MLGLTIASAHRAGASTRARKTRSLTVTCGNRPSSIRLRLNGRRLRLSARHRPSAEISAGLPLTHSPHHDHPFCHARLGAWVGAVSLQFPRLDLTGARPERSPKPVLGLADTNRRMGGGGDSRVSGATTAQPYASHPPSERSQLGAPCNTAQRRQLASWQHAMQIVWPDGPLASSAQQLRAAQRMAAFGHSGFRPASASRLFLSQMLYLDPQGRVWARAPCVLSFSSAALNLAILPPVHHCNPYMASVHRSAQPG